MAPSKTFFLLLHAPETALLSHLVGEFADGAEMHGMPVDQVLRYCACRPAAARNSAVGRAGRWPHRAHAWSAASLAQSEHSTRTASDTALASEAGTAQTANLALVVKCEESAVDALLDKHDMRKCYKAEVRSTEPRLLCSPN